MAPRQGALPTARGLEAHLACFDKGVMIRYSGDTMCMSPPLIVSKGQIDQIVETLSDVIKTVH
jgi:beta-alanine--pyruvate transaminase